MNQFLCHMNICCFDYNVRQFSDLSSILCFDLNAIKALVGSVSCLCLWFLNIVILGAIAYFFYCSTVDCILLGKNQIRIWSLEYVGFVAYEDTVYVKKVAR